MQVPPSSSSRHRWSSLALTIWPYSRPNSDPKLDILDVLTKAANYMETGLEETGLEETYFEAVLENQVNQFIALNLFAT